MEILVVEILYVSEEIVHITDLGWHNLRLPFAVCTEIKRSYLCIGTLLNQAHL